MKHLCRQFNSIKATCSMFVAVIGTTIAPWMQFYQQSAIADKHIAIKHLSYERLDTYVGAFITDFVAFFIVVSTGATLFIHHIQINQASDVVRARPTGW